MNASAYLPEGLVRLARFLRSELAPFPSRINVALRCVLASAIVIVTSMALEVPALALSLICVFYVSQSNVVITRLAGILFMVGATLAVALALLLIVLTFDHPLLRIVMASLLLFACAYLMRILKVGVMFFIAAIILIYVQSFVDQIGVPDPLVRLILWVWVATTYPILTALLVNTWLLPIEPLAQLRAEIHRQLTWVGAELLHLEQGSERRDTVDPNGFLTAMLAMQKLLKFAAMRDKQFRADEAYQLALISSVARLYRATGMLPAALPAPSATQIVALRELRSECAALAEAAGAGLRYRQGAEPGQVSVGADIPGLADMWRTLRALSDYADQPPADGKSGRAEPMVVPDAFSNPVYARFALKTLLAVLIGYVFYNAADWQGIHTIMLTCLIVALPSLGASAQKSVLRVGGALVGSALALFMVVFVVPRIDTIVGLLLMALPVVAIGAWAAAGSERISYAGIQLMFTFALALLERFGPTTDLTEIRDRIVGILLGVGLSVGVQVLVWPEGEADTLRGKLAGLLRSLATLIGGDVGGAHMAYVEQHARVWTEILAAEAMLARVSMEPDWREGENELVTLRAQVVLANARELLVAADALHDQLATHDVHDPELRAAVLAGQRWVADELDRYAEGLAAEPPAARKPLGAALGVLRGRTEPVAGAAQFLLRQLEGLPDWHGQSPEPVAADMPARP